MIGVENCFDSSADRFLIHFDNGVDNGSDRFR